MIVKGLYDRALIEADKAFADTVKKELFLKKFEIKIDRENSVSKQTGGYIWMDDHVVKNIHVDQYNNLDCKIPKPIPTSYLPKFGQCIHALFEEKDSYKGRSWIGFYIEYFRIHNKHLDKEDLKLMFRHPKFTDDGFKEWLVGTSYSSNGNIPRNYKYTEKELRAIKTSQEIVKMANEQYGL